MRLHPTSSSPSSYCHDCDPTMLEVTTYIIAVSDVASIYFHESIGYHRGRCSTLWQAYPSLLVILAQKAKRQPLTWGGTMRSVYYAFWEICVWKYWFHHIDWLFCVFMTNIATQYFGRDWTGIIDRVIILWRGKSWIRRNHWKVVQCICIYSCNHNIMP